MDITILGITLTLAALWLLFLTFVVVLLVRQVGLITLQTAHRQPINFNAAEDGPKIGDQVIGHWFSLIC